VSGAKFLFDFPFIDSTKIGIQGHSWGGYETNYLVTHTNIFAAAVEGAGPTDFISNYGTLLADGFEKGGQKSLQATLWEDRTAYISNSPIFDADKVTTPLLMMHNKKDLIVPWSKAVELFIALRRLNKKVWMLQYDNGGHGVSGNDAVDYTIRMTQFFDHYLKDTPPAKWMTKGIPAKLK
jgi:dipeptidyl aminopeptidase/acylaminoacyl peptidase